MIPVICASRSTPPYSFLFCVRRLMYGSITWVPPSLASNQFGRDPSGWGGQGIYSPALCLLVCPWLNGTLDWKPHLARKHLCLPSWSSFSFTSHVTSPSPPFMPNDGKGFLLLLVSEDYTIPYVFLHSVYVLFIFFTVFSPSFFFFRLAFIGVELLCDVVLVSTV